MATYPLTQGPFWRESGNLLGATPPVLPQGAQGAANGSQPAYTNVLNVDAVQKYNLGTYTRFRDDKYGEIEAIYLQGVASLQQYDAVVFDEQRGTTVRTVAASRGPLAIALSNPNASQFGWFLVKGQCPTSTAGTGGANTGLAVSATAGQLGPSTGAAADVLGSVAQVAQGTCGYGNAAGYTDCTFDRPTIRV